MQAFAEQLNMKPEDLWPKLVGFGSDGAAVMRGVRNGVGQKLKANQPKLQLVHCIAHRLELAIKDAVKASTLHGPLQKLLLDVYLFYHKSTLNRGLLRTAAQALGVTRYVPTRSSGTRWIGHTKRALENLFCGYPAIVQHLLEVRADYPFVNAYWMFNDVHCFFHFQVKDDARTSNDTKGKSAGFLKKLLSRETVEFGHFLLDVITVLDRLSAQFQQRTMSMDEVPQLVADTVSSLKKLSTRLVIQLSQ